MDSVSANAPSTRSARVIRRLAGTIRHSTRGWNGAQSPARSKRPAARNASSRATISSQKAEDSNGRRPE